VESRQEEGPRERRGGNKLKRGGAGDVFQRNLDVRAGGGKSETVGAGRGEERLHSTMPPWGEPRRGKVNRRAPSTEGGRSVEKEEERRKERWKSVRSNIDGIGGKCRKMDIQPR